MKKYFVLALALMAFAVAPVMADVALSGEYSYSAMWNTGDSKFAGTVDKMELDVKATLDDYNTFKFEIEDDDKSSDITGVNDLSITYAKVITDWGKYFGFAETGFGMTTTTGQFDVETKETADFTGYGLEYGYADLGDNAAIMFDFDVMGMVDVYYGMGFNTYVAGDAAPDGGKGFLFGAQASIDPVTAEVYYKMTGTDPAVGDTFGLEAAYSGEVTDGVVLNVAGHMQMVKSGFSGDSPYGDAYDDAVAAVILAGGTAPDEFNTQYGLGIGAEAYGATVNASFTGMFLGSDAADAADGSYFLSMLGIDAEYSILEWLSVNAGFLMNMGDYAADFVNDEAFSGAEFGVAIMPGAVTYQFGYVIANEDAGNYINLQSDAMAPAAAAVPAKAGGPGGIYFIVDLDY